MSWRRRLAVVLALLAAAWTVVAWLPVERRPPHPFFAGLENRVQVVAHRGGAAVAPESTLPLFRIVDSLGVDILDLDLHVSADSALVVLHDRRVDRVTEGTGRVAELTLAQLQALDAGYRWSPDGGLTHPYRGRGVRIPSFRDVLEALPGRRLVVELKSGGPAAARQLCADLRRHDRQSLAIVASFRDEVIGAFRQDCPQVATATSTREGLVDWVLRALRLDAMYEPAFDAYLVPRTFGPVAVVTPALVARARERGRPVQVWTINREEEMERLITLGVDGIMTDRPDLLLDILRRRGLR